MWGVAVSDMTSISTLTIKILFSNIDMINMMGKTHCSDLKFDSIK